MGFRFRRKKINKFKYEQLFSLCALDFAGSLTNEIQVTTPYKAIAKVRQMGVIKTGCSALAVACLSACTSSPAKPSEPQWVSIFDGETLEGWTPKIAGQELGEDRKQIFRVEGGHLAASYEEYTAFSGEFGHLFYADSLTDYRLRFSYAFGETQVPGGPAWAFMNSGVMVHAQAPETMRIDQPFPVSIEAQLLGRSETRAERTTANMCSPGTHVVIDGALIKRHCVNSQTRARVAGEWTVFEVEVRGNQLVSMRVDGEEALRLSAPEYDPADADVARLDMNGLLSEGYFALQAESHEVAFKDVELMRLDPSAP